MNLKDISTVSETPLDLGFRMPAEWESHEATWLAWPHNRSDWPGKMAVIPWVYAEMVKKISTGEEVRIIVCSKKHEKNAIKYLDKNKLDLSQVKFFRFGSDRSWTRDFGPMFIRNSSGEVAVVRFRFNAWAKYRNWKRDDAVPEKAAKALGTNIFYAKTDNRDVVLEGGSIEVNGKGTLITTEECLLDPKKQVRNPGLTRSDLENILRNYLGVKNVLWLGMGIAGDDTHGHIDDICRFVNEKTLLLCREKNPQDENYRALAENWERIQDFRLENGSKPEVIPLPMPEPLYFKDCRLPASYANFYISNAAVLVPTFNDPSDRIALGILSELITDRPVVGIHAVDLVWGLGTIHCLTQQQPR